MEIYFRLFTALNFPIVDFFSAAIRNSRPLESQEKVSDEELEEKVRRVYVHVTTAAPCLPVAY